MSRVDERHPNAPIVIVGTGLAGYTTARELRKLDADTPLTMITADEGHFYSKPMISNALGRRQQPMDLPTGDAGKMAAELSADIRTNTRVEAIDTGAQTITVAGEPLAYSKLVLAVGADPIRLELGGDAAAEVFSVNDLYDYVRFRDALASGKRVAVLGAGLIGCEFANDLLSAGYEVDVVEAHSHALGRLIPAEATDALCAVLAAQGVRWHFATTCEAVNHADGALRLTLADGDGIDCDVVLSAVGLRPRTGLATAAGLAADRGIVVDRTLRASAADVYALGDCAQVDGLVLPFIMPIMHAARALAKILAGQDATLVYPPMPVVVKTPAHPVVVSPPAAGSDGEWRIERGEDGVRAVFLSGDGATLGFVLTGKRILEKAALTKSLPPLLA